MRTALIQGMENANKTGTRSGWVVNGGLMEGVEHGGNRLPGPGHPTLVRHARKVFFIAAPVVKSILLWN